MDYSLIFNENITKIGMRARNSEEVIHILGNLLLKEGYVKDTFIQSTIQREKEFSTGLPLGKLNVALPHTDSKHVNQQGIALGVLDEPVEFHAMGNSEQVLPVRLVFLLAIKEDEDQVKILQKLVDTLQKPSFVDDLVKADSNPEIVRLLYSWFKD